MFAFDARRANEQLVKAIAGYRERLWPIGVLDPTVPTWREDLEDGLGRLDLAGFRLHPNYHDYTFDAPEAVNLAEWLADAGCPLFIALYVDEERLQHPAIRVPAIPIAEIVGLLRQAPKTTIVLNSLKVEHALSLWETGLSLDRVYLDIGAMDKPFDGLQSLMQAHGVDRFVFGSQMPFLYPEAALMVVEHSNLAAVEIEATLQRNWQNSPVLAGLAK